MINLSSITVWALGVAATVALAAGTSMNNRIGQLDTQATQVAQRVSVVETKSDQYQSDIMEINKKLDALLYSQGINPAKIK